MNNLNHKRSQLHALAKKIMYVAFFASIVVSLLGLYFYLSGPEIVTSSIRQDELYDFTLSPGDSEAIEISPYANMMLENYHALNLSDMLLNRTIIITMNSSEKVDLYVVDLTKFKEGNISKRSAVLCKEGAKAFKASFSPPSTWQIYCLVVENNRGNKTTSVYIRVRQEFIVKKPIYTKAFNWLKVGILGMVLFFVLQAPLRLTLDDIMLSIENRILPVKYRKYVKGINARMPIFYSTTILAGILIISVIIGGMFYLEGLPQVSLVARSILEDYFYRFGIAWFLTFSVVEVMFVTSIIFWKILTYIPLPKLYPNAEIYRETSATYTKYLKEAMLRPYSICFHVGFLVALVSALVSGSILQVISLEIWELILTVFLSLYLVFLGYMLSIAYLKTQEKLYSSTLNDFTYEKAVMGSAILISIIFILESYALIPFLNMLLKGILDKSILYHRIRGLCFSEEVISYLKYVEPYVTYLVPLASIAVYYLFVLFTIVYLLRRSFQDIRILKSLLRDTEYELLFFIVVFLLSLWLESLYTSINFRSISISLLSSFIASTFRNYLKCLKE